VNGLGARSLGKAESRFIDRLLPSTNVFVFPIYYSCFYWAARLLAALAPGIGMRVPVATLSLNRYRRWCFLSLFKKVSSFYHVNDTNILTAKIIKYGRPNDQKFVTNLF
jgi:hypothetical protein